MSIYSFGEVFVCRFPFTSGQLSKPRPVLILFDFEADVVICRITSAPHSSQLDIPIHDWQAVGLVKPSVARLNRLVTTEKDLLTKHLGHLSVADAAVIKSCWNRFMVL